MYCYILLASAVCAKYAVVQESGLFGGVKASSGLNMLVLVWGWLGQGVEKRSPTVLCVASLVGVLFAWKRMECWSVCPRVSSVISRTFDIHLRGERVET